MWGLLPVGSTRCPVRFPRSSRRSGVVAVDRPLWRRGNSPTTALSEDADHALQFVAPRLGQRDLQCPENALSAADSGRLAELAVPRLAIPLRDDQRLR